MQGGQGRRSGKAGNNHDLLCLMPLLRWRVRGGVWHRSSRAETNKRPVQTRHASATDTDETHEMRTRADGGTTNTRLKDKYQEN